MDAESHNIEIQCFIPIYGSYYHFMTESALGLYQLLERHFKLESLDCKLWYQGGFNEIVQMFSSHPVINIPIVKPYLKDASSIQPRIKTLVHKSLNKKSTFRGLVPMANFLSSKIPFVKDESGITLIKRVKKRVYMETDELAEKLKGFNLPVRVVQLETLPFSDQVHVMRNTSILIAPHGAGTLNQMFMPKGGKVIEFFPQGYSNWHAKEIAKVFGHQLLEIESDAPGLYGRKPSEEIRKWIEENGWPDKSIVKSSRKKSEDPHRIVRDVESYSIDTNKIIQIIKDELVPQISGIYTAANSEPELGCLPEVSEAIGFQSDNVAKTQPVYDTELWASRSLLLLD